MNSWQKELSHINQSRFCFITFSHIWYSFCFPNIKLSTFSCQQLQWVIFIFNTFCLIFLEFSAFLNRTTTVPGATASQDLTNMQIFVAKCKFLQRHYHQLSDGTLLLLVARWIYSTWRHTYYPKLHFLKETTKFYYAMLSVVYSGPSLALLKARFHSIPKFQSVPWSCICPIHRHILLIHSHKPFANSFVYEVLLSLAQFLLFSSKFTWLPFFDYTIIVFNRVCQGNCGSPYFPKRLFSFESFSSSWNV